MDLEKRKLRFDLITLNPPPQKTITTKKGSCFNLSVNLILPIPKEEKHFLMEMDFIASRSNLVKHNKEKVLLDSESANRMHHFPHEIM